MDFAGNSIYTDKFEDTNKEGIGIEFYLEANRTLPLIVGRYTVNITLYDVDAIFTSYFYHHDGRVCVCIVGDY